MRRWIKVSERMPTFTGWLNVKMYTGEIISVPLSHKPNGEVVFVWPSPMSIIEWEEII